MNNNNNASWELKCCVCGEIPVDVVDSTCCASLFCWECGTSVDHCPHCNAQIIWEGLKANPALQKIIDTMEVKCRFEDCNIKTLSSLRKEHESTCDYRPSTCPNSELCGIILFKDLTKHLEEECPERSMDCPYHCGQSIKLSSMLDHIKNTCDCLDIDCTQGCGKKLKKKELRDHLDTDCVLFVVPCEFNQYGCKDVILRADYKEHLITHMHQHFKMLTDVVKIHETEINSLKQQLQQSHAITLPDISNIINQSKALFHNVCQNHRAVACNMGRYCCQKSAVALPYVTNIWTQVKQNYDASQFVSFLFLALLYRYFLPQFIATITFIIALVKFGCAVWKNADPKKIIKWLHYVIASFLGMGCCCVLLITCGIGIAVAVKTGRCRSKCNRIKTKC